MGKNAIKITATAGTDGTALIMHDAYVPINHANFKKFIAFGYKATTTGATFSAKFYARIQEFDGNLNLLATQDYEVEELGASLSTYEFLKAKLNITLNNNTKYIKVGLYIELTPPGTADLDVFVSYLFLAEQFPISMLQADGSLNMGNQLISNVADPESASDVATKNYVDSKDPTLKQYDSSDRPTCNASNVGMMILYNYENVDFYYQDFQVCMGNDNIPYQWVTIKTIQQAKT